jgi:hypothetical protein
MVEGGDHQLHRHAIDTLVKRQGYDEKILAVFRARERLLLAVGLAIAKLREAGDPLPALEARIQELLARVAHARAGERPPQEPTREDRRPPT